MTTSTRTDFIEEELLQYSEKNNVSPSVCLDWNGSTEWKEHLPAINHLNSHDVNNSIRYIKQKYGQPKPTHTHTRQNKRPRGMYDSDVPMDSPVTAGLNEDPNVESPQGEPFAYEPPRSRGRYTEDSRDEDDDNHDVFDDASRSPRFTTSTAGERGRLHRSSDRSRRIRRNRSSTLSPVPNRLFESSVVDALADSMSGAAITEEELLPTRTFEAILTSANVPKDVEDTVTDVDRFSERCNVAAGESGALPSAYQLDANKTITQEAALYSAPVQNEINTEVANHNINVQTLDQLINDQDAILQRAAAKKRRLVDKRTNVVAFHGEHVGKAKAFYSMYKHTYSSLHACHLYQSMKTPPGTGKLPTQEELKAKKKAESMVDEHLKMQESYHSQEYESIVKRKTVGGTKFGN